MDEHGRNDHSSGDHGLDDQDSVDHDSGDHDSGDRGRAGGPRTTGPAIRIRAAGPADADAIAVIHQESRRATMPYLPPQRRTHEQVARWVREIVLVECHTLVAVRGPEILGYAAVEGELLDQLYLRPDIRRQGLGSLLLAEAQRHRPDGLTLHVFQLNDSARAFYERHGFTVIATGDGSGNMENLPDLTLRWTPGPTPGPEPDRP